LSFTTTMILTFTIFALLVVLSSAMFENEYGDLRVICVGCSSGIGASAAQALMKRGAKVVVSARRQDKLNAVVEPFSHLGVGIVGDASSVDSLSNLVKESRKFFGKDKITTLLWCPTALETGPLQPQGAAKLVAQMKSQLEMNVYSFIHMVDMIAEDLIATGGKHRLASITAVSSMASHFPVLGHIPYGVAKSAQDSTVKQLALEYGAYGIRVNSVAPAAIDTPIFEGLPDTMFKDTIHRHRLGRAGKDYEVGDVMAFLSSKSAGFITGQVIDIDGGAALLNSYHDWLSPMFFPGDERYTPVKSKWTEDKPPKKAEL